MCLLQAAWLGCILLLLYSLIYELYEQVFDSVAKLSVENIENAQTLEELI